jgi:DNA-binding response OmpR family regulator
MEKILILSEDKTTSSFLGVILQREHFLPILANSPQAAVHDIGSLQPDLLMIEVPVAGRGPVELCMELAACHPNKHIMILGDGGSELDKVLALEAGADDYIVKPFAPRELVARVRALLRRGKRKTAPVIRFGNVEVDRQRRIVTCRGKEIPMTPCEYKLLLFFLSNADMTLTRQTLLQSVWGYNEDASTRTLDAHVSKLRNKCETDPSTPRHFMTIHGVGYRFVM